MRNGRGFIGGSEGVQRALALLTPSEGPRKALGTPSEPSLNIE